MYERSWTVLLWGNNGPAVITIPNVRLPRGMTTDFELQAWAGNVQPNGPSIFILEGNVTLEDAQAETQETAELVDCLMAVPGQGIGTVRIPRDMQESLTVYWDNKISSEQSVTVRIKELK